VICLLRLLLAFALLTAALPSGVSPAAPASEIAPWSRPTPVAGRSFRRRVSEAAKQAFRAMFLVACILELLLEEDLRTLNPAGKSSRTTHHRRPGGVHTAPAPRLPAARAWIAIQNGGKTTETKLAPAQVAHFTPSRGWLVTVFARSAGGDEVGYVARLRVR
jgi:hypothetical protein